MNAKALATRESIGIKQQALLMTFCLISGLAYRASVSLIPSGIGEDTFIIGAAALLLVLALVAKRANTFASYWEIPFAFCVFYVAGFFGDGNISPIQHFLVSNVLRENTSANNPLASTVTGTVLAQLGGTILLALPVVALTIASGRSLEEIFIARPKNRWGLVIGVICFAVIWFLALRGRTVSFFPIHGLRSRFLFPPPPLGLPFFSSLFRRFFLPSSPGGFFPPPGGSPPAPLFLVRAPAGLFFLLLPSLLWGWPGGGLPFALFSLPPFPSPSFLLPSLPPPPPLPFRFGCTGRDREAPGSKSQPPCLGTGRAGVWHKRRI